jgi:hypothetical protein
MHPYSASELRECVKNITFDIDPNKYIFLSDHRPTGASIFIKNNHICDLVSLNVLSKQYICFLSGVTLEGKSCTEANTDNWKVDLKLQYGVESSPLVKLDHIDREIKISHYIKKLCDSNPNIVFGLQEVTDSQYTTLRNELSDSIIMLRTELKKQGENHLSGVIAFNSDVYTLKHDMIVIKCSDTNNNNYISHVTLYNKKTTQNFILVNTHVQYGKASSLSTYLLEMRKNSTNPIFFIGDSNCSGKIKNICEYPTLTDNFNEIDFGFNVPMYNGTVSWTNINIRKNVMNSNDIDWLWNNRNKILSDDEKNKQTDLINRQCDIFDVIGIVYNMNDKSDVIFKEIELFIDSFKC